jgi:hypothetical protein
MFKLLPFEQGHAAVTFFGDPQKLKLSNEVFKRKLRRLEPFDLRELLTRGTSRVQKLAPQKIERIVHCTNKGMRTVTVIEERLKPVKICHVPFSAFAAD